MLETEKSRLDILADDQSMVAGGVLTVIKSLMPMRRLC